jgi:hypothetical protein
MRRCRALAALRSCSKGLSVCWPETRGRHWSRRRSDGGVARQRTQQSFLLCSRNQAAARGVRRRVAVRRAARPLAFSSVAVGRRARWRVRCQRYVPSASVASAPLSSKVEVEVCSLEANARGLVRSRCLTREGRLRCSGCRCLTGSELGATVHRIRRPRAVLPRSARW